MSVKLWWRNAIRKLFLFLQAFHMSKLLTAVYMSTGGTFCDATVITFCFVAAFSRSSECGHMII